MDATATPLSERAPRQARDVVTFGQEAGRALSDGRIVGRAEPFAKVFPSSRQVKRAVGLVAWAILEDIALDATLDCDGRLVASTNVRRIATNLGINKDTAAKHLARLRDYGFVLQEEGGQDSTGRWETCRYILDPAACLERFTHTPTAVARAAARTAVALTAAAAPDADVDQHREPPGAPVRAASQRTRRPSRPTMPSTLESPCPRQPDTARQTTGDTRVVPVSEPAGHGRTGHGDLGHNREELAVTKQQTADPLDGLLELGIAPDTAASLVAAHPPERIVAVVGAARDQAVRNPAGWTRQALAERWDLGPRHTRPPEAARWGAARRADTTRRYLDDATRSHHSDQAAPWAAAVDAALDDDQLATAVAAISQQLPAMANRSTRIVRAQLLGWAAAMQHRRPGVPLGAALANAIGRDDITLADDKVPPMGLPLGASGSGGNETLTARLSALLTTSPEPHPTSTSLAHARDRNRG